MRYFLNNARVVAVVGAVVAAGCSSVAPQPPAPPPPIGASTAPVGGDCDAQGAQWAVGKSATAKVLEQARVRAGARMARVLHPGQVATMEFDPQRLSLSVDGAGKVKAVSCG